MMTPEGDLIRLDEAAPVAGPALAWQASVPQLTDRRAIIDRRKLDAEIETVVAAGLSESGQRARVLAALKATLAAGREEIRRRFEAGAPGTVVVRAHCHLMDQLIRVIYDHANRDLYPMGNLSAGERLALVAVGGYGRGELAPHSDIDLLFLLPYKRNARHEQMVEAILYYLWDLGLKVGHAVRSLEGCLKQAKEDFTIQTTLLESRYLWGDQALFVQLRRRFRKEIQLRRADAFIDAKLAERDQRHKRLGDSRYVLEPNIKDGKGGLRDLHTLFWITKFLYRVDNVADLMERGVFTKREVMRFAKAQNFLWTLRCHLHYLAGRADERLTFDLQTQIAPRMGYKAHAGTAAVERFMKHYFLIAKDVGNLTRIFCAALAADHKRRSRFLFNPLKGRRRVGGFKLEGDRLSVANDEIFAKKPVEMLRIFQVAQEHDLDIHPEVLRAITRHLKRINKRLRADPDANRIFLEILTSKKGPETALRRMNEAGVFGRFVPDFGRVVAQMQYNMYHHFTVDEHTIFAIGILHRIEQGGLAEEAPIATEVVHKVLSRRVLYLAVFLHDIAKGRRGDHSEVGAKIARKLCPRLGISEEETETVAWLVLHHLAMSDTAFKRDLDDPQTVETFADRVQSMERLRLLLVLTVADIRAVGPGTWTAWKAALLRELYWRTEEVLTGGLATEGREARIQQAKEALAAALSHWPDAEREAHLARGTAGYWLSLDTETHVRHADLVRQAEIAGAAVTVDARVDAYREATEVTVYAADSSGLFSRIAGAIAVAGGSIETAKIFTLANGKALDSFYVHDSRGRAVREPGKRERLVSLIERALAGDLDPVAELAKRRSPLISRYSVFKVAPRVLIDNQASAQHTVIEVNGRDRTGLLYHITRALTDLKLMIHTAKISTYGERAVDVFYVTTAKGNRITGKVRQEKIRNTLLRAIEAADPQDRPAKAKPKPAQRKAPAEAAKPGPTGGRAAAE